MPAAAKRASTDFDMPSSIGRAPDNQVVLTIRARLDTTTRQPVPSSFMIVDGVT